MEGGCPMRITLCLTKSDVLDMHARPTMCGGSFLIWASKMPMSAHLVPRLLWFRSVPQKDFFFSKWLKFLPRPPLRGFRPTKSCPNFCLSHFDEMFSLAGIEDFFLFLGWGYLNNWSTLFQIFNWGNSFCPGFKLIAAHSVFTWVSMKHSCMPQNVIFCRTNAYLLWHLTRSSLGWHKLGWHFRHEGLSCISKKSNTSYREV